MIIVAGALLLSTCEKPETPRPEITSVNPTKGAVGDQVTITGKNLQTVQTINFGNVSTTSASSSETTVITVVPGNSVPGVVSLTVKSEGGTSDPVNFEVLHSAPELTSIDPDKGAIGMDVTLHGKYFETATSVAFGDKTVTTFLAKTDLIATVKIPDGQSPGAVDVTITTAGGTSDKFGFTIVGKPTITALSPSIGPVSRVVTITGTNLTGATKVLFNNGEAVFEVKSPTIIESTVPATATTGKVKVITPGGEAISAADFTLKDGPSISSFAPVNGAVGTEVTITGTSFDAGNVAVKFGDGAAVNITVVNATQIKAKVPSAATSGKISVETAAGSVQSTNDFTVVGAPTLASFVPTGGSSNQVITLTGTNFVNVSGVMFNGTAVAAGNYTLISSTQITVKVPAGATSGKISVTTQAGTANSPNSFTVIGPPTITSFSPAIGAVGVDVIITGTNFTGTTAVKLNGMAATYTVNSATGITAKVPNSSTSGKFSVTTPLGTVNSANTFYVKPFITNITPVSGAPGSNVTITGTNLENATLSFGSSNVLPAANTATTINAVVPSTASGSVNVSVANAGGTSNIVTFSVVNAPVLDEIIAPQNIAGQLILLKGNNLLGATTVHFGAVDANVVTSTAKVVTAIIPASLSLGPHSVTVTTPKGTSQSKTFELLEFQNGNSGGLNLVNNVTVVGVPSGYVPPVSNVWRNDFNSDEAVGLGGSNGAVYVNLQTSTLLEEGVGIYDLGVTEGVLNNYIEFTVVNVRYVGVWTPPSVFDVSLGKYCFHHMTLISAESGQALVLTVKDQECE